MCDLPPKDQESALESMCGGDLVVVQAVQRWLTADIQATKPASASFGSRRQGGHFDLAGRDIGAYRLKALIGSGGMGAVYLAECKDAFRDSVAIKIIHRGMNSDEIIRRFQREQRILARLNHPNIARLLDGNLTMDGTPYFVMEYVEGMSIIDTCNKHRLNLDQRLRLFRQVCDAVHHAHQHRIIHRDLKPGNILVHCDTDRGVADGDRGMTVKLLDFGIAKIVHADPNWQESNITQPGDKPYTPQYASPEQHRGERVMAQSDVYALGLVLYELVCGERPYELKNCNKSEVQDLICEIEPRRPSIALQLPSIRRAADPHEPERPPFPRAKFSSKQLAGDVDKLVMTCLRKTHADRYATAKELSSDIDRILRREPLPDERSGFGYWVRRTAERRGGMIVSVALVLAAMIGIPIVLLWGKAAEKPIVENVHMEIADMSAQSANWELALTQYDLALRTGAEPCGVRLGRAEALLALGRLNECVNELNALRVDPAGQSYEGESLLIRADVELRKGDANSAVQLARGALDGQRAMAPRYRLKPADEFYARGLIAAQASDAVGHFENACQSRPCFYRADLMLIMSRAMAGASSRATEGMLVALGRYHNDPAIVCLGGILAALSDDSAAAPRREAQRVPELANVVGFFSQRVSALSGALSDPEHALCELLWRADAAPIDFARVTAGRIPIPPWWLRSFGRLAEVHRGNKPDSPGDAEAKLSEAMLTEAIDAHPDALLHVLRARLRDACGDPTGARADRIAAIKCQSICTKSAALAWLVLLHDDARRLESARTPEVKNRLLDEACANLRIFPHRANAPPEIVNAIEKLRSTPGWRQRCPEQP